MPKNFLLGFGERLTEPMSPPPRLLEKDIPYTFEESVQRLVPQIQSVSSSVSQLPTLACPDNEAVISIVLHPEYTAKSYYPQRLLNYLELEQVGSKGVSITPEKWTRESTPHDVFSTEIFVSGKRGRIEQIPQILRQLSSDPSVAQDLVKIEQIKLLTAAEKIKPFYSDSLQPTVEVVLQVPQQHQRSVLRGFEEYLHTIDLNLNTSDMIISKGLCFLALKAERSQIEEIALFSFLRVLREMPKLRGFEPMLRSSGVNFPVSLPDIEPEDPNLRVAIFDGGFPENSPLSKWVDLREIGEMDQPLPVGVNHGHKVASAFLFGPIKENEPLTQPPSFVDLYRIFDIHDDGDNDEAKNLYKVLKRVKDVLHSTNYQFVSFSCGPDLPIEDDEVHAWTSVLDEYLSTGNTLAMFAVGNTGRLDWESGNARVQPASDCVNGLAVGSSDKDGQGWNRASYSSIGPGRLSGYIKPDLVTFGGSSSDLFWFADHENVGYAIPDAGTSFATPLALRTAVKIRTKFGSNLSPLGIRTLLIHSSILEDKDMKEVGWGILPTDVDQIVMCGDDCIRVLYQSQLNPSEWMKIPIPLPDRTLKGMVEIKATLCFATPTDPEDAVNYTRSGLEVVFRPHSGKRSKPEQVYADSQSFFKGSILHGDLEEDEHRRDSHRWETVRSASIRMRGTSLQNPEFNVHYIAREGGNTTRFAEPILYSMVVEIHAKRESNLYNEVFSRYRTHLEILRPRTQIDVRV